MGKSIEKLGSSRSPVEEREMGTFLFLDELNDSEGERCWRGGEMYKYPLALNSHLSRGSAAAQVR